MTWPEWPFDPTQPGDPGGSPEIPPSVVEGDGFLANLLNPKRLVVVGLLALLTGGAVVMFGEG